MSGYAADLTTINPTVEGNRQNYLELFRRNVEMSVDGTSIRVDTIAAPVLDPEPTTRRHSTVWRRRGGACRGWPSMPARRLVWEFEPGSCSTKPSEVLAMHQQVGHPNFRVMFDTSTCTRGVVARQHGERETLPGGVPEFLHRLDGRIGDHLIDSDGTLHGEETSTHRPFGEGYIDFRGLAPQLLDVADMERWCIDMCFWADAWELVANRAASSCWTCWGTAAQTGRKWSTG